MVIATQEKYREGRQMYLSQEAEKLPNLIEDPIEEQSYCYPELLALKRHDQFVQFLRDEWRLCRTKAEKEVVLSAFVTATARVRRLERKLNSQLKS
jgi:hypothetical protein